jgi:hypothetical protein
VTVLNQIYEVDFLGFSYGFRPGRSAHDALDALWVGIRARSLWLPRRSYFVSTSSKKVTSSAAS